MGSLQDANMTWMVDLAVTGSAQLLLLIAGLRLRRYAAANRASRPIAESFGDRLLRRSRPRRLRQFEGIAASVLRDASALLSQEPLPNGEARAFLPIVAEVRVRGEVLLKRRRRFVRLLSPARESRLAPLVRDLARIETALRELPRSRLSLDDVLAGRFDLNSGTESG